MYCALWQPFRLLLLSWQWSQPSQHISNKNLLPPQSCSCPPLGLCTASVTLQLALTFLIQHSRIISVMHPHISTAIACFSLPNGSPPVFWAPCALSSTCTLHYLARGLTNHSQRTDFKHLMFVFFLAQPWLTCFSPPLFMCLIKRFFLTSHLLHRRSGSNLRYQIA